MSQRVLLKQVLYLRPVNGIGDGLRQFCPDIRAVAIPDGLNQEVSQRAALELKLAGHVENSTAKSLAGLFQLFKQGAVNVSLSGFVRDQIPEMAYLRLSDAMDTAKALLDSVRVPRKVVVHHQVRALQVDAFA